MKSLTGRCSAWEGVDGVCALSAPPAVFPFHAFPGADMPCCRPPSLPGVLFTPEVELRLLPRPCGRCQLLLWKKTSGRQTEDFCHRGKWETYRFSPAPLIFSRMYRSGMGGVERRGQRVGDRYLRLDALQPLGARDRCGNAEGRALGQSSAAASSQMHCLFFWKPFSFCSDLMSGNSAQDGSCRLVDEKSPNLPLGVGPWWLIMVHGQLQSQSASRHWLHGVSCLIDFCTHAIVTHSTITLMPGLALPGRELAPYAARGPGNHRQPPSGRPWGGKRLPASHRSWRGPLPAHRL